MVKSKNKVMNNSLDGYDELFELALDLRWSWEHDDDDIWRSLNEELWNETRNPKLILESIPKTKIQTFLEDKKNRQRISELLNKSQQKNAPSNWFSNNFSDKPLSTIAYFSMEFMLGESLPIYSGGLGNVAGDQLKAASDLGVPVVGISLLYQQGYFRQMISNDGTQEAFYPINDPGQLPISPARNKDGEWIRFQISLSNNLIWVRAWQAKVGQLTLYLLDANDPANPPLASSITAQLYGGGSETRIAQEFILGIGGWRLLQKLDINPEVCHLNEGHAAFVVLERAANFMKSAKCSFQQALLTTRAGNLFTTHTPVAAGFDSFNEDLMRCYFESYAKDNLEIPFQELMALGRINPADNNEPFNMAYLALRGSGAINGVSKLHGKVSREIFQKLFPRWANDEVPIGYVTNGIHVDTWDSKFSDYLWTKYCGKTRWMGETDKLEKILKGVPDEELWDMRQKSRSALIDYVRIRYSKQITMWGASSEIIEKAKHIFNPNALTLGFARRFATYKRPTFLLKDPDRLIKILCNPERPVQLIIAGKAHPADIEGQNMIKQWIEFTRRPEVQNHVIFLSDYDMLLTEQLTNGVDVWINNPRRPWEACGTSGMKVLANGGLNLSELDGWWAEAYNQNIGWALGDGHEHGDDPAWDAIEANKLYEILEKEVVPQFYERDQSGIPNKWLIKVRESMATLTAQFSSNRSVREYTKMFYIPAAESYQKRRLNNAELGKKIFDWQSNISKNWGNVHFGEIKIAKNDEHYEYEVAVFLGELNPDFVKIQLYAEANVDGNKSLWEMTRGEALKNENGAFTYYVLVPANRPVDEYTARVIPYYPDVNVPLEASQILWQK